MAKTPNAPTNMSFLSTGRKFLEATRSPAPASLAHGGRFPGIIVADSSAPTQPGTPIGSAVSTSQINWTWGGSTDSGGSGLQGYRVYVDGSITPITTTTGTTYSSTGHSAGTAHTVRVEAFDGAGNSTYSPLGSQTTQSSDDEYAFRTSPLPTDKILDQSAANDSGTGTEALPWKTFTVARLRTLVAGQALWVKNGTYPFVQAISGLANGTALNRITIAAYPGHTPTITGATSSTTSINSQWAIGNCAYWDFRGINFSAVQWALLIGPTIWDLAESPANNIRFIDCTGTKSRVYSSGENTGILWCDRGGDFLEFIRVSLIGPGTSGFSNDALIWVDRCTHLKVIGCVLDNADAPFYFKHDHGQSAANVDIQFKNNIFRRGGRGVTLCTNYFVFSNNSMESCDLDPSDDGGGGGGLNCFYTHNTFVTSFVKLYVSGAVIPNNNTFRGNLYIGTAQLQDNPDGQLSSRDFNTDTDYNAYGTGSSVIKRNSLNRSLAQHKLAFTDQEQHSVAGTNTLAGGSSPGNTAANWALLSGSAGKGAANDGADCGVNATNLLTVN